MHGVLGLGEAVVRELPLARRLNEPHSAQVRQVARDRGLGQPEDVDDVADAELPSGEHAQDADASRVGKALEDRVEISNGRCGERGCHGGLSSVTLFHIRQHKYNMSRRI